MFSSFTIFTSNVLFLQYPASYRIANSSIDDILRAVKAPLGSEMDRVPGLAFVRFFRRDALEWLWQVFIIQHDGAEPM